MVFVSLSLAAQETGVIVSGSVADNDTDEMLPGVSVQLYSQSDTVLVTGVMTDFDGNFSFKAKPGNYLLRLAYIGYVTKESNLKLSAGKKVELGIMKIGQDAVVLEAAKIAAEVPPVTSSGDTLVYNTAAFRVAEGSMLEELIKKYPGVTIEDDGTIKLNGKTVNRILMKGKNFFGTDKDMALMNI